MKYTKSERKYHVVQQSDSGLTMEAYCKKEGINYHTFNNWRRKYKNIGTDKEIENTAPGAFVEVEAPGDVVSTGRLNIYLPNGIRLQLDQDLDAGLLKLLSHV